MCQAPGTLRNIVYLWRQRNFNVAIFEFVVEQGVMLQTEARQNHAGPSKPCEGTRLS